MGQTAKWFDGRIGTATGTATWQLELTEFLKTQSWRRVVIQVLVRDVRLNGAGAIKLTWQGCVQADSKFLYDIARGGSPFATNLDESNKMFGPVRIEWGAAATPGDREGLAGFLGFRADPTTGGTAPWSATIEIWVLLTDPV